VFSSNALPNVTTPGHLDREVTLYSPTLAADHWGQMIASWSSQGTVWAAWSPAASGETQQADQLTALVRGTLRIRYHSTINSSWRVVLGSVTFEIIAPPAEIGRQAFLDLHAHSLNTSAP